MKHISLIFALISFISFTAKSAPTSSFELLDNRIIIQVSINGQGPFFMMFDTGATNILSSDVAAKLGLKTYNNFPINGGGENPVTASYCDVQKLEVSSQSLQNSQFICMDLKDMQRAIGFPRLDGLIGYEIFKSFQTEINFDKMQISLNAFSQRGAQAPLGQRVSLSFYGTTPVIEATLDGIAGRFLLDTGDRASATLSPPFIQRHALMQKYHPDFSTMTGYGIGGPISTSMAFVNQLQMSGRSFAQTLVRLPTINSRALSDPEIAGTLGMGLLRQFNILLDYSRAEMILSKNSAFEQDRRFDRSGMWLAPGTAGFEVMDVLEKGPAWIAGIRPGQVILAVDNIETAKISVLNLREQLKDPKKSQVVMLVRDGSKTRSVVILLKDLVNAGDESRSEQRPQLF